MLMCNEFLADYMDRFWWILFASLALLVLITRPSPIEPFDDAEQADDGDEDDDEDQDVQPLTTEPDTRKAPKQKSTLPAAPVVAEGEKLKAKPIAKPKPIIKASGAEVKSLFKVEKKTHLTPTKDAIIFTPRRMLCMPSASGFQCLYQ